MLLKKPKPGRRTPGMVFSIAERKDHLPGPLGFLCCQGALLAHIQFAVSRDTWVLFFRAVSDS